MLPKRKRKKAKATAAINNAAYLDVKREYLENPSPLPSSFPPPLPPPDSSSSSDEAGEVRLRASEKRDILLYYILENFYTIDEAHKNTLYAFLLKLSESKAIDFDPFVQSGLYSHFRKQLDTIMLDVRSKASVRPLLQGIHSSNYNNNMVSRAAIDFESLCFLGKGGFGEVIKVRNRIDGMMYALKKVRFRDLPNSEKNLEKVLREVKALAQLDHENVLRYYNAWIEVEHASDYTKKMLEAVSHRPQLPVPFRPPTPPSPLPPLSPPLSSLSPPLIPLSSLSAIPSISPLPSLSSVPPLSPLFPSISPLTPPPSLPLSRLSVEVSTESLEEETKGDESEQEETKGDESEEEETKGDESGEEETKGDQSEEGESSYEGLRVGAKFGCAAYSTEEEDTEEEREREEEREEKIENDEEQTSEGGWGGVDFEEVISSGQSSHAEMHGINTVLMGGKGIRKSNSSSGRGAWSTSGEGRGAWSNSGEEKEGKERKGMWGGDSHSIHSVHSGSSTSDSSHGMMHGINTITNKITKNKITKNKIITENSTTIITESETSYSAYTSTEEEEEEEYEKEYEKEGGEHSIESVHSNSSSSHSNMHGINLETRKDRREQRETNIDAPKRAIKRGGKRAQVLPGFAGLSLSTPSPFPSSPFPPSSSLPPSSLFPSPSPSALRISSELGYAPSKLRRSGELGLKKSAGLGPNNFGPNAFGPKIGATSSPIVADYESGEEFGKGDEESDLWEESGGTSASKNFSHEVSGNNQQLVPFVGKVPHSPPPPPPKNRYVLYIQMQLCEAKTLKSFLDRPERHINFMDNMKMFQQVVAGLHHIHARGLIHRDLKPDNIFFTSAGAIKIGDFGLSKQFCEKVAVERQLFEDDSSPHTMGIGTKSYASPEQIRSNFYTEKSDVYSLGIILFELFNVFSTYTERAKVLQDLREGIVPQSMWSKFPDVARAVLWMMDSAPENRPSTSDILHSSLMTLSQGASSLVVKQREEILRLQEKIMKLEQELKLSIS